MISRSLSQKGCLIPGKGLSEAITQRRGWLPAECGARLDAVRDLSGNVTGSIWDERDQVVVAVECAQEVPSQR